MAKRKSKTLWCYLDGKKFADVIAWALAANVSKGEAKQRFIDDYPLHQVTFVIK